MFQDVSAARVGSIKSITDASQPFAKEAVPSSSAAVPPRQEEELDTATWPLRGPGVAECASGLVSGMG